MDTYGEQRTAKPRCDGNGRHCAATRGARTAARELR